MIKPDYINGWTICPECTTADTSSLYSDLRTSTSSNTIASEINKRVRKICREHEERSIGVSFNDLEKELKELGIELSTVRQLSAEDVDFEIEGRFKPRVYKARMAREKLTPVHPVGPKPVPKKVKFNGPATIIFWEDGTKTTVKCSSEDVWDDDVGIAMCYLKKMLGNKGNFNNIFREAMKVAEVQYKKEDLNAAKTIDVGGESYYSSALDSMKRNIDEINDFMKNAAEALDQALGGKK